jgi:outer membrane protein assembly factor BamB
MRVAGFFVCVLMLSAEWPQWGGPDRDFAVDAPRLADAWPAGGPKKLWSRPLGDGYSAIVGDASQIITMYRRGHDDVVIALDAGAGKTQWEFAIPARHEPGMGMEHGPGPHSTPLVAGNRVFVVSVMGKLQCLDRRSGKALWAHDLWEEYGGTRLNRGYAASPIAYREMIIVPVGGAGHAVMAFHQSDGKPAWQAQDFANTGSSPVLIDVGGLDQLVVFMAEEVAGLNPLNGDLQWRVPHTTDWSNRMRIHHGNAIRVGGLIYGSSGDFGPAPLSAIDARTGKVVWQDRGLSKANFIYADGKLIGLDEDGTLGLVKVSERGGEILAKSPIFQGRSWTAPTLVGSVLYARDRREIAAFELK